MHARRSARADVPGRLRSFVERRRRAAFLTSFRWRAGLLRLLTPLAFGAPALFWVIDATRRFRHATLGRDQGIFQYIAWAVARGAVDYRDVRDVNGPLTHLWHRLMLAMGGADELRFRSIDLAVTAVSFAAVGACIAGVRERARPSGIERLLWAGCAWVVLSAQYLLYDFWDTAQRESFFDCLLLPSVAVQLACGGGASAAAWPLVFAGASSVMPWFGKPTYALFTLVQVAALSLGAGGVASRWRRLRAFAIGSAMGAAIPLGFLLSTGDPVAFLRIALVDVPATYRFIWPRSVADILSTRFYATYAALGVAGAIAMGALIALEEMPIASLPIALLPLCALAGVFIQAKGFPYHFHPVTAGVSLQALVVASWAAERARVSRRGAAIARAAPVLAALVAGVYVAFSMQDSPYIRDAWLLWASHRRDRPRAPEDYAHFVRSDFFPDEMRRAAAFVHEATKPDGAVQTYGMDPYLLFLAGRLSATPYIYAYELNVDAALAGGTGAEPDRAQAEQIRVLRDRREDDLFERITRRPPAAWVFVDGSPLLSQASAWDDFEAHCRRTAAWVVAHYRPAAHFGHDHVWLPTAESPGKPAALPTSDPIDQLR